jgi:hypothetical protein
MMFLSRTWYVVLSLLLAIAAYVVYLAVGQYNRRNAVAMSEELASDSQTVGWALQIDARKRLDALLIGSVDKGIQDALQGANGKDPLPAKPKDDARKALLSALDKTPQDYRPDALFAVDHDGRVVAQVGFDQANAFPDFELGGYPAVFDAMHGFLRDDTWVLGGRIYRVVARPVEIEAGSPPAGAIVALRAVDKKFAQDLSKRTRANVAFYAAGQRIASAAVEGFEENQFDLMVSDLPKLGTDKSYPDGRSDVRMLNDDLGVMYARLFGDAWDLGAGFAVARTRVTIAGPLGFVNGADDKDKQSVPFILLAAIALVGIGGGLLLSLLEHSRPLKEMVVQSSKLRKGELDYLQLARFRGRYRDIAQELNAGIERVVEKGGGGARKPADLESILGPVPAQPAMSAFSFPLADGGGGGPPGRPGAPPGSPQGPFRDPMPTRPGQPPRAGGSPFAPGAPPQDHTLAMPGQGQGQVQPIHPIKGTPIPPIQSPVFSTAGSPVSTGRGLPPPQASSAFAFPPPRPGAIVPPGNDQGATDADGPTMAAPSPREAVQAAMQGPRGAPTVGQRMSAPTIMGIGVQSVPGHAAAPPAPPRAPAAPSLNVQTSPNEYFPQQASRPQPPGPPPLTAPRAPQEEDTGEEGEEEETVVAPAPSDLLSKASGTNRVVSDEAAEWTAVYEDFVRTKKQCGEPTDGLTYEKFQHTLKKNRDALMQRHNCKRVRFSVYIKEGRASLKATPVRE